MRKLISGAHHIALKCENYDQFKKTLDFYTNLLGLDLVRLWGENEESGAMINLGNSILEVFATGKTNNCTGTINHFALATEYVDECVKIVREAGYEITMEPIDIVIPSKVPMPVRIAFCIGPVGEEIEFFNEK